MRSWRSLNPTSGDAGDFQQVINQARQLSDLAFDDALGLALDGSPFVLQTQQMHGGSTVVRADCAARG